MISMKTNSWSSENRIFELEKALYILKSKEGKYDFKKSAFLMEIR